MMLYVTHLFDCGYISATRVRFAYRGCRPPLRFPELGVFDPMVSPYWSADLTTGVDCPLHKLMRLPWPCIHGEVKNAGDGRRGFHHQRIVFFVPELRRVKIGGVIGGQGADVVGVNVAVAVDVAEVLALLSEPPQGDAVLCCAAGVSRVIHPSAFLCQRVGDDGRAAAFDTAVGGFDDALMAVDLFASTVVMAFTVYKIGDGHSALQPLCSRIRLKEGGGRSSPFWRIVVAVASAMV